jgi:spore maturation protein CgeB
MKMSENKKKDRVEFLKKFFREPSERSPSEKEIQEALERAKEISKAASQYLRSLRGPMSNKRYGG